MSYPILIANFELSGQPATQYLCGFSGSDSLLLSLKPVISDSDTGSMDRMHMYLLLDGRYWEQGENEISNFQNQNPSRCKISIIKIHKEYTQIHALKDLTKKYDIQTVMIDSRITSHATVLKLQELGLVINAQDGAMQKMREIKSEGEIQKIQNSQRIALQAFDQLLPHIKIGACEGELAAKMEYLMKVHGAQGVAFNTIVASGPHSALPHATPTDRKITTTDAVIVDFGARVDGYCSDFTRTILMSDAPQKLHEIYALVERAQAAAIVKAVAGTPLKDLDTVARNIIETAGYDAYFTHSLGHGVGMEVHELPHVSMKSEGMLQTGHVITIEPGIYIPGLGGVRLEEMILVK